MYEFRWWPLAGPGGTGRRRRLFTVTVAFPLGAGSGRPLGVFAVPFLIEGEREQHSEPEFRNVGERHENMGMLAALPGCVRELIFWAVPLRLAVAGL